MCDLAPIWGENYFTDAIADIKAGLNTSHTLEDIKAAIEELQSDHAVEDIKAAVAEIENELHSEMVKFWGKKCVLSVQCSHVYLGTYLVTVSECNRAVGYTGKILQ